MDTLLQAFLTWQFLFFCLAIGAVVFVIRQIVEYWMENGWPLKQWYAANKEAKLWRGLILPILPILLGQAGALLAKQYPYPEGFTSTSGRIVFGLVAGFTSGLIVRLFRSFLSDKISEFKNNITSRMTPKDNNEVAGNDVSGDDVPKRGQP
jgi:hypothetical protein